MPKGNVDMEMGLNKISAHEVINKCESGYIE